MNLYIMRHGETAFNKMGKIQGSSDIPLTDFGIELAEITADGFAKEGVVFDRIITSQLVRATRTAEEVAKKTMKESLEEAKTHGHFLIDERLREMCFGQYEGCHLKTIAQTDPNIVNCFGDVVSYIPDPTAESYEELLERLDDFLKTEIYPLEADPDMKNVLVVCHGTVIRAFLKLIRQFPLQDFWKISQPNCCVNLFELKDGVITSVRENILYYECEEMLHRGIW